MALDFPRFYDACNPSRTLVVGNPEDRQYYIDFASVRGGKIIEALGRTITRLSPNKPTCQLFTGHIGCGKSTELLRLKTELEQQEFHVVYFDSTQDLDIGDVDVTDIMLAIAREVSTSLEKIKIYLQPQGFKALLKEAAEFLQTPVEVIGKAKIPGGGTITASTEGKIEFSLPLEIGSITAKTKASPKLRDRLRKYLEPRTNNILQAINEELLIPATETLKQQGKTGLVVIIDSLDRVDPRPKTSERSQQQYLFIDRGDQLRQLKCHVVYSIPLALMFSNEYEALKNRLGGGVPAKVLPMVPVQFRDGRDYQEGLALLRQMVLARAFPDVDSHQRLNLVIEVFDSPETLDRLCRVSGGHVRNLLGLLYRCIQEEDPPLSLNCVENVIREYRDGLLLAIDNEEWEMLHQVVQQQSVSGEAGHQTLLRSLFVFEYQDRQGRWFGINPALAETEKFKSWQQ